MPQLTNCVEYAVVCCKFRQKSYLLRWKIGNCTAQIDRIESKNTTEEKNANRQGLVDERTINREWLMMAQQLIENRRRNDFSIKNQIYHTCGAVKWQIMFTARRNRGSRLETSLGVNHIGDHLFKYSNRQFVSTQIFNASVTLCLPSSFRLQKSDSTPNICPQLIFIVMKRYFFRGDLYFPFLSHFLLCLPPFAVEWILCRPNCFWFHRVRRRHIATMWNFCSGDVPKSRHSRALAMVFAIKSSRNNFNWITILIKSSEIALHRIALTQILTHSILCLLSPSVESLKYSHISYGQTNTSQTHIPLQTRTLSNLK